VNINPSAAASVAGTSRAAAQGGDADNQSSEATSRQSAAEKPAGKATDSSAVDAGDQTGDRGGNGQQLLDVFEQSGEQEEAHEETRGQHNSVSGDGSGEHLDLEA
jgi:hypothetical protein